MYETLEHWNQYKQEKELKNKLKGLKYLELAMAKLEIDNSKKLVSDYNKESFDKWMNDLVKKNGITKY